MIKTILTTVLIAASSIHAINERYIQVHPQLKLGKYENGNYFMDARFMELHYDFTEQFSFSGSASVGFTAERNSGILNQNHYTNIINIKSIFRPFKNGAIEFFVESNFSNLVEGNNSSVDYFRTGNYQAVGISYKKRKIIKNI